jgi:hypothetical protein
MNEIQKKLIKDLKKQSKKELINIILQLMIQTSELKKKLNIYRQEIEVVRGEK